MLQQRTVRAAESPCQGRVHQAAPGRGSCGIVQRLVLSLSAASVVCHFLQTLCACQHMYFHVRLVCTVRHMCALRGVHGDRAVSGKPMG